MSHDNGVHEQHSTTGEGELLEKMDEVPTSGSAIAEPNENPETVRKLEDYGIINSSTVAVPDRPIAHVESNGLTVSKELGVKKRDLTKGPIHQKVQSKAKDDKPFSLKCAATTGLEKSKDGKDMETTSALPNGSLALNSRPKEPFSHATKSISSNDKGMIGTNSKPRPAKVYVRVSQQSIKSDAASLSENVTQSEGLLVKTKLKPLAKGPPNNAEGSIESTPSPTALDGMPRRVGSLPAYNFSFKCNERAEKRKEFYCKLEKKIHAKEVEKSDMQARTKETQEAELKMLRKTLTFKATPMPTFYQEPPPPKPELKKIPPTRAKSPKLGRKGSPTSDIEGNTSGNLRPVRLSLGEKSENNATEGIPTNLKKTQRKSLPKLPSEKTILTLKNKTNETESNEATLPKETGEIAPNAEPSYAQPNNDDVVAVEDQAQTNFVEEPIALEN